MGLKFLAKAAAAQPKPNPRIMDNSREDDAETLTHVRQAQAEIAETDKMVDGPTPEVRTTEENRKLSRLIDHDFPFDESQVRAIDGVVQTLLRGASQIACMTGAAGTGKTTCTKKIVDEIIESGEMSEVDLDSYWKSDKIESDGDEDYEVVERWVPSVALVGFTGRSTQMIKKNFPRDWHGNIMTIHRMLAYMPEFYEEYDDDTGEMRNKMRFIPTYDANFKLPWDYIIIDEAGMVGIDLWENIRLAMKDDCKVIMIGDINQLPPVHGRSVFGFAMSEFPAYELTHIHRQEGTDNPIVDNAWRVLKGELPVSGGAFQMIKFDSNAATASKQIRKLLPTLQGKGIYDPIRDTTITPINGEDGARGFALGQIPLNREFAIIFNDTEDRFIIDAGRERKVFGVGDKVMATRNDHQVGITNGMTGVITSIVENGGYAGDKHLFGRIKEVNAWLADNDEEDEAISFDDLYESVDAVSDGMKRAKEDRERGPASHIVTVRFGSGEHSFEIPFGSRAEVCSLMTAYVVTCHKMQGGESPVVVIILHDTHRAMLNREWLYTAITRASQKCILCFNQEALRVAINKQRITGNTLAEKVKVFKELSAKGLIGARVNVNLKWGRFERQLESYREKPLEEFDADRQMADVAKESLNTEEIERLARLEKERLEAEERARQAQSAEMMALFRLLAEMAKLGMTAEPEPEPEPTIIDGGTLTPFTDEWYEAKLAAVDKEIRPQLAAPTQGFVLGEGERTFRRSGAIRTYRTLKQATRVPLLPAPLPAEQPKPVGLKFKRFGK